MPAMANGFNASDSQSKAEATNLPSSNLPDRRRYALPMTLTLDPATEQLLQQELAVGHYTDPLELLAHGLELVTAVRARTPKEMNDWLLRNKDAIAADLEESFAQAERGEGFSPEEIRERLAKLREAHPEFSGTSAPTTP
jgi:hypothetical protein